MYSKPVNQIAHFFSRFSLFRDNPSTPSVPVSNIERGKARTGNVILIGAGPGDPELLTIKAHRMIQSADIILVDWLVNKAIFDYFPKSTDVIFVGKRCGKHSMEQKDICQLILQHAQLGKTVVRLKGGDPSIFGRLAEETDILRDNDIPFSIIPGITAATGCAAYSGIPLTHRDCAQSVKFITASFKDPKQEPNWQNIASGDDTLVFYMGLSRISKICSRLIEHGMKMDMPVAIIDQGTLQEQQVCISSLTNIDSDLLSVQLKGPAIIVVGEVVNKRQYPSVSALGLTQQSFS